MNNIQSIIDSIINLNKNNIYTFIAKSVTGDNDKMALFLKECSEQIEEGHVKAMEQTFNEEIVKNIIEWKKTNS